MNTHAAPLDNVSFHSKESVKNGDLYAKEELI